MEKKKYFIYNNDSKDTKIAVEKIKNYSHQIGLIETNNVDEANLIISIGGDGTLLKASKLSYNSEIFGINKGTLGYLTEVSEDNIVLALSNYINNNYTIQPRMMLDYHICNNNNNKNEHALNDIVIAKADSSTIELRIYVDDVPINTFYADGVIVSTPTGSTGYSLSCNGPIVDPRSEMIIVTPIAPHSMINRSMVFAPSVSIKVKVMNLKVGKNASLFVDGNKSILLEKDVVCINKSKKQVKLVSFNDNNFFEKLKDKMK